MNIYKSIIFFVLAMSILSCNKNKLELRLVFPNNFSVISTETPVYFNDEKVGAVMNFYQRGEDLLVVDIKLDTSIQLNDQANFKLLQYQDTKESAITINSPKYKLKRGEYFGTVQNIVNNLSYDETNQDSLKQLLLRDSSFLNIFPNAKELLEKN